MSLLGNRRKKWGWESDVPRCQTCTHCRPPPSYLMNGTMHTGKPLCEIGEFFTRQNAVCDRWQGKKGETLV